MPTTSGEKSIDAHSDIDSVKEDVRTTSDNDTAEPERPVRRKLQETRITSEDTPSVRNNDVGSSQDNDRGRLKKRSHDDLQIEEEDDSAEQQSFEGGHRRKRSRDAKDDDLAKADVQPSTPEATTNDDASHILSPKKKRSLDQLKENGGGALNEEKPSAEEGEESRAEGERETKRHRDASKERQTTVGDGAAPAKSSLSNAFLNTSAVSPFASLGSKSSGNDDSKSKTTSPSAFAASGLASFAGLEQSPFGALGKSSNTTPSVFSKPAATTEEKSSSTGFGAAATASPFANTGASGFAALGSSGFGGGFGGSGFGGGGGGFGGSATTKLSSFASATGSGLSGSPAKPFGAEREEEEEEEEEEGNVITAGFEKEKEDERFYEQQIETGEEEEKTYFSCKAKLFHFTNKEWKERGVGTFKVNVKKPPARKVKEGEEDSPEEKISARMIMRADGVLRVMLNTQIFKGMPVGDVSGEEPKGKQLNLASVEDGKTIPLLLRVGSVDSAIELYHIISDLQKQL